MTADVEQQARPHDELICELLDSRLPKTDREHAAAREIEALRAEVAAWRELSDHVHAEACKAIWPDRYIDERIRDVAAALKRAERLREALSAYQAAVNKIDDLIEYALPMPRETKAALYAVLADLTATLAKEITND